MLVNLSKNTKVKVPVNAIKECLFKMLGGDFFRGMKQKNAYLTPTQIPENTNTLTLTDSAVSSI